MSTSVTASMLYNLVRCPHRLNLDLHQDPGEKDPESKFVQLLWESGNAFEREVIEHLKIPFTDLKTLANEEREHLTREAMGQKTELIYGGRIRASNLLGEPDLLRWDGTGYVAGDIKSGSGEEAEDDWGEGKPKKHYAIQLALYTDILEKLRVSSCRVPFVWDVHGNEVPYVLDAPQGSRTPQSLWDFYLEKLALALRIVSQPDMTLPALAGTCKQCHWHSHCTDHAEQLDDLTLIPGLGRTKRDVMLPHIGTTKELSEADISQFIKGNKTTIKGIGPTTLAKFKTRAQLLIDPEAKPYLTTIPNLPISNIELFFDIEADPMREICYLHGFIERRNQGRWVEKFVPYLAEAPTAEEEERVFAEAWHYVQSCKSCVIYYFSRYERTWWRKLQQRYPSVVTTDEIEAMFEPPQAIDLYTDVVQKCTEWPTRDHSIKTLASYLGFKWRDTSPSGADSIEWYHRWVETGDPAIRERILKYNEDDCVATRVLLDGIRNLSVK